MNAQQAADFLSESPQHEISRHKAHIKILEEALTMKREAHKELQSQNVKLLEALEAIRDIQSPVGGASYEVATEAIRKVKEK